MGDSLTTHRIQTRNGGVQVITLPWLTRSTLMTRQETESLSLTEVNQLLIERLQVVLEAIPVNEILKPPLGEGFPNLFSSL